MAPWLGLYWYAAEELQPRSPMRTRLPPTAGSGSAKNSLGGSCRLCDDYSVTKVRWGGRRVTGAMLVVALGVGASACSSGTTSAQQQTAALRQVQVIVNDLNALSRTEETYSQDVQSPCPANLTPGTFPGYNCGQRPPLTPSQLQQAKDSIPKARAQLADDERKCQSLLSELKDGKAGKYILKQSNCEPPLPPAPRDSPAT